ncbi:ketopantoate reductase PanE/ApbA-domain-containing protein [Gamsiella multidivaricata]|uniref:ketopantoate reductase PanE/ApbA-domain-containing protein n=1 Tax=Gamsiella multidivaricata TaxID=101098 RepID=UPI00221EB8D9|nr:ketopantoate reductase PanE/ApbA-domain-containing protein [Gamsiella multidivaricata]KAG0359245.1 2-dehydropantoate 2-reductase (Ketopantoate reductase) (KPA reductase) (KPR) [Gamsiella multidivaricata]KAI7815970.1 ketopantoate reductase PanE/ApbA-domain-containing protein [Gamsiella multidivaricata]
MTNVPLRPMNPRFHILGPGGIGSLFAFYFYQNHIPFTFFQRRAPPPAAPYYDKIDKDSYTTAKNTDHTRQNYPPTTLKYMNLTSLETTSVEPQVIDGLDWEPLYPIIDKELFRHDPVYNELSRSPIHQLLVTTKTYQTVEAISKIRHRLRPWTTIVLMQNGMGVREEICESMGWTTEEETPNFVQGIISHGAQKTGDTIVHTGTGHVWLAPVVESSQLSSISQTGSTPVPISRILKPSDTSLLPKLVMPKKEILTAPYPYRSPASFIAPYTNAPFSSFYTAPSSVQELQDLRTRSLYETLSTFQELSAALNLRLLMPDHLLALQLSKLVVNACVNPVATLLEATNGALLDSSDNAHPAVKDLLKESHSILRHSLEYRALNENLRQEFLTLEALTSTTEGILRATRQNRCSTLQDYLKGSRQCEIEYMNGYLIKMAERDRAPGESAESAAPLNRMVTEKIKEKFAAPRKASE